MYLASYIESLGYSVEIKDVQNETLGMTEEKYQEYLENDFSDYITSASPDFIGMGVLFSLRYFCALKIIQAVKLISPTLEFNKFHSTANLWCVSDHFFLEKFLNKLSNIFVITNGIIEHEPTGYNSLK
jgi:hypothetical protein